MQIAQKIRKLLDNNIAFFPVSVSIITAQKLSLYSSNILVFLNSVSALIFVPTHLGGGGGGGGGRNYILICIFLFSQLFWPFDIFIVELRLVSLESLSSVEYGIKKFFLIFVLQGVIEV